MVSIEHRFSMHIHQLSVFAQSGAEVLLISLQMAEYLLRENEINRVTWGCISIIMIDTY